MYKFTSAGIFTLAAMALTFPSLAVNLPANNTLNKIEKIKPHAIGVCRRLKSLEEPIPAKRIFCLPELVP